MASQEELQAHLDKRFDRLENKLDDHLNRISKAEADITWVKGAGKLVVTVLMSLLGFLAQVFWHQSGK